MHESIPLHRAIHAYVSLACLLASASTTWCVTFINRYLWRPNRIDEALNDSIGRYNERSRTLSMKVEGHY
jgi:hypothetical protein